MGEAIARVFYLRGALFSSTLCRLDKESLLRDFLEISALSSAAVRLYEPIFRC